MAKPKPKAALTERQRELWATLNDFDRENDGAVISPPGVSTIVFACGLNPSCRAYCDGAVRYLRPAGTTERLMPVSQTVTEHGIATRKVVRQHVAPQTVAIHEFPLPFD